MNPLHRQRFHERDQINTHSRDRDPCDRKYWVAPPIHWSVIWLGCRPASQSLSPSRYIHKRWGLSTALVCAWIFAVGEPAEAESRLRHIPRSCTSHSPTMLLSEASGFEQSLEVCRVGYRVEEYKGESLASDRGSLYRFKREERFDLRAAFELSWINYRREWQEQLDISLWFPRSALTYWSASTNLSHWKVH